MTDQLHDRLWYQGEKYALERAPVSDLDSPVWELPLEPLFAARGRRPRLQVQTTANWRGYVATWEIQDDMLWLVDLAGSVLLSNGRPVQMLGDPMNQTMGSMSEDRAVAARELRVGDVFEGVDKVVAEWYSGRFSILFGEPRESAAARPIDDELAGILGGHSPRFPLMRRPDRLAFTVSRGRIDAVELLSGWRERHERAIREEAERRLAELDTPRKASVDEQGWIDCPHCGTRFKAVKLVDGRHRTCSGRIDVDTPR